MDRSVRFLRWVLVGFGALFLLFYLWVAFSRISYPFDLEWIEGGILDQVQRIAGGQNVYVSPSPDFVPFLYTPLYFYLAALVMKILGPGFLALRLISLGASLVTLITMYFIVRKETGDRFAAFLATGAFIATFRLSGAWLDIARVDSLFLAFLMLFIYFIRWKESRLSFMAAGLFLSLAFLTKQVAFFIAIPIIGYYLVKKRGLALPLLAVALTVIGGTTLLLNYLSGGWYLYYTFNLLHQQTQWIPLNFLTFWTLDLLAPFLLVIVVGLIFFMIQSREDQKSFKVWLLILAGVIGGAFISRVKQGGYDNVLLPAYALIMILFGLGFKKLLELIQQVPHIHRGIFEKIIYLAFIFQLVIFFYNPVSQIPTQADRDTGAKIVDYLAKVEGEVFIPGHPYLATLAGKKTYAHDSALWDVIRGDRWTEGKMTLEKQMEERIIKQYFRMIILDGEWRYAPEMDRYYECVNQFFQENSRTFRNVTGMPTRPMYIYVPRKKTTPDTN